MCCTLYGKIETVDQRLVVAAKLLPTAAEEAPYAVQDAKFPELTENNKRKRANGKFPLALLQPAKSTRSVNPLDRCFFLSCAFRAEPKILLKLFHCFSLCPKQDYNMCRPKRKVGEITNGTKKNYRRSDTGLSPISDSGRKERGHRGEIPPGRPCFSSLYRRNASREGAC